MFPFTESEEYTSLPPTSLSQDSYDFQDSLPVSRPTLETSVSVEYGLSSQAEGRDESDGSGMSRSLDRKMLWVLAVCCVYTTFYLSIEAIMYMYVVLSLWLFTCTCKYVLIHQQLDFLTLHARNHKPSFGGLL